MISEEKGIIVYYSRTGSIEQIASYIKEFVDVDVLRIEPINSYPEDLDEATEQAKKEIQEGYMPPLKTEIPDLSSYTTFFFGTPCWWSTMAPPLKTFLNENPIIGKKVIVFEASLGSGMADVEKDIRSMCQRCIFEDGFSTRGSSVKYDKGRVKTWLKKIGIIE